jgi:hypothetical protein
MLFPEINSFRNNYSFNYRGSIMNKLYYQPLFDENEVDFN